MEKWPSNREVGMGAREGRGGGGGYIIDEANNRRLGLGVDE